MAYSIFDPGCGCCGCSYCLLAPPLQLQAVIAALTNGSCASCASFNGTYILDLCSPQGAGACGSYPGLPAAGTPGDGCYYIAALPAVCSAGWIIARYTATGIVVQLLTADFGTIIATFSKTDLTAPFDCRLVGTSLPNKSGGTCTVATASCTVTAL